eukprot:g1021.t1
MMHRRNKANTAVFDIEGSGDAHGASSSKGDLQFDSRQTSYASNGIYEDKKKGKKGKRCCGMKWTHSARLLVGILLVGTAMVSYTFTVLRRLPTPSSPEIGGGGGKGETATFEAERQRLVMERERIALEIEKSKLDRARAEAQAAREAANRAREVARRVSGPGDVEQTGEESQHLGMDPKGGEDARVLGMKASHSWVESTKVSRASDMHVGGDRATLDSSHVTSSNLPWNFQNPMPSLWLRADAGVDTNERNEVTRWEDSSNEGILHWFESLSNVPDAVQGSRMRPGMHHLRHSSAHVDQERKRSRGTGDAPTFVRAAGSEPASIEFPCALKSPTMRLTDRSTVFLAIRPDSLDRDSSKIQSFFGSSPHGQLGFFGDKPGFFGTEEGFLDSADASLSSGSWALLTYRFDRFVEISVNGDAMTRQTNRHGMPTRARFGRGSSGSNSNAHVGQQHVGVSIGGANGECAFRGRIGEVLLFPAALSDIYVSRVLEYLSRKWSASDSVVGDKTRGALDEIDEDWIARSKEAVRAQENERVESVIRAQERARESEELAKETHDQARDRHMSPEQFQASHRQHSSSSDSTSSSTPLASTAKKAENSIFTWMPEDDVREALVVAWQAAQANSRTAIENGSSDRDTEIDALVHIRTSLFGTSTSSPPPPPPSSSSSSKRGQADSTRNMDDNDAARSASSRSSRSSSPITRRPSGNIMTMPAPSDAPYVKRERWEGRLQQIKQEVRDMKIGGPKLRAWLKEQKRDLYSLRARLFGDV